MIGLDTNVIVRYLTRDDERQFKLAEAAIQTALQSGEQLYLCTAVLLETVWVLERVYSADRSGVATLIQRLLETASFELENEPLVEAALDAYQLGNADFADYVIALGNRASGCRYTLTFDRRATRFEGFKPI